jgi:hypothetical protein
MKAVVKKNMNFNLPLAVCRGLAFLIISRALGESDKMDDAVLSK